MCRLSSMTMTVRYGGEFTRSACDPFCISGETGSTRAERFPVACLFAIRPGVANVTGNIPNGILSRQTCNDCDRSCPENFASRCQGNCSAVWPCNLATINTYQQYQQQYQKHTRTQGLRRSGSSAKGLPSISSITSKIANGILSKTSTCSKLCLGLTRWLCSFKCLAKRDMNTSKS